MSSLRLPKMSPLSLLKFGGLALLIAFAFVGVDYGAAFDAIGDAEWDALLIAFLLLNLGLFVRAIRWHILATGCGLDYRRAIDYYAVFYAGWFAGWIIPQGLSSVARLAIVSDSDRSLGRGLAAVIIERLADVVAAALLGLLTFTYVIRNGQAVLLGVVLGLVSLGMIAMICLFWFSRTSARAKRLRARLEKRAWIARAFRLGDEVYEGFINLAPRLVAEVLILSLVAALILATAMYVTALSLDISVSYPLMVSAWALISLSLILPISIQGLGPREGILIVALVASGEPRAAGLALGLLWFVLLTASRLPGLPAWLHRPASASLDQDLAVPKTGGQVATDRQ